MLSEDIKKLICSYLDIKGLFKIEKFNKTLYKEVCKIYNRSMDKRCIKWLNKDLKKAKKNRIKDLEFVYLSEALRYAILGNNTDNGFLELTVDEIKKYTDEEYELYHCVPIVFCSIRRLRDIKRINDILKLFGIDMKRINKLILEDRYRTGGTNYNIVYQISNINNLWFDISDIMDEELDNLTYIDIKKQVFIELLRLSGVRDKDICKLDENMLENLIENDDDDYFNDEYYVDEDIKVLKYIKEIF